VTEVLIVVYGFISALMFAAAMKIMDKAPVWMCVVTGLIWPAAVVMGCVLTLREKGTTK
jgi:hypothetical protein